MSDRVTTALRRLSRRKAEYGSGAEQRKAELLGVLAAGRLPRASDIKKLHDALCFLRAYPDSAELLTQVERMLAEFARRSDLRRHRHTLTDSGIDGTPIHFTFFAPTASWLARRWGGHLTIDWEGFEQSDKLERMLPLLALYCETPGLDEYGFEVRDWIDRLKGPQETDAAFLLRRLEQLRVDSLTREVLYDELEIPLRLSPGPGTPARTREKYTGLPIVYQSGPFASSRPPMPDAVAEPPLAIRSLSAREGQTIIDLARSAMVVRSRDLDAFAYGEKNDVRLVDCGNGLQLAYIGMIPKRRLLLETVYGFLMLKNGVPVGYGVTTVLFGSAEIAYTVFDTFRAGEATLMFVRVLAIAKHVFGADTFMIDPYQLGEDNDDAIRSGAWWFYQKLGFRPRDAEVRRIMRRELRRARANPAHRSSTSTLKKLATANVFLHLEEPRDDVLGALPLANVGLKITDYISERFGFDREKATRTCCEEASRLLGVRSQRGFSAGERLAWKRWALLVMVLPGVKRWRHQDKRALVEVVRAKGGTRESDYLRRFDRHRRLRQAIRSLADSE